MALLGQDIFVPVEIILAEKNSFTRAFFPKPTQAEEIGFLSTEKINQSVVLIGVQGDFKIKQVGGGGFNASSPLFSELTLMFQKVISRILYRNHICDGATYFFRKIFFEMR
jgi:hypothetical protein